MAVTVINQNGAASSEVRALVQNLRTARAAARNIQEITDNMDAGQMLAVLGLDPTTVPMGAWNNNIDALVTILDNSTIQNFTGLLV